MRNTTDPKLSWKAWLEQHRSKLGLAAALASPFLIFALLIDGPLPHRLLGAAALLLAPVFVLYSYRGAAYAVGLLIALSQRREERKRGEEEDAKRY